MPYELKGKCVYNEDTGKRVGCSSTIEKAKKHLTKLRSLHEEEELANGINQYFQDILETPKDAKVLRSINTNFIKKEVSQEQDEEIKDYFVRIQQIAEEDPPIFPKELVRYFENLDDRYFPRDGRKMFAKWLGNALYYEETDGENSPGTYGAFQALESYNNDIRYIVDYLNGAEQVSNGIWNYSFTQMVDTSREWHNELKGVEQIGDYETKNVIHDFNNGFIMVEVPSQDLEVEGNKMGHCVGGYCEYVSGGSSKIFSLRDKRNEPHVTIEIDPRGPLVHQLQADAGSSQDAEIVQIKGKGNDIPVEKYRLMVKQWIQDNFEPAAYLVSDDYLDMLSSEEKLEITNKEEIGSLTKKRIKLAIAADVNTSDDILLVLVKGQEEGWQDQERLISKIVLNAGAGLRVLKEIIKIELKSNFLRDDANLIFNLHAYDKRLSPKQENIFKQREAPEFLEDAWEDIIKPSLSGTKKGFLSAAVMIRAIAEHPHSSISVKEDILNTIVNDDISKKILNIKPKLGADTEDWKGEKDEGFRHPSDGPSGKINILKEFAGAINGLAESNISREALQKIYDFGQTKEFQEKFDIRWLNQTLVKNRNVSSEMVGDILTRGINLGFLTIKNIITNKNIPTKHKYHAMKIAHLRVGVREDGQSATYIRLITKEVLDTSDQQDPKFMVWLINSGWLDWYFGVKGPKAKELRVGSFSGPGQEVLEKYKQDFKQHYVDKISNSKQSDILSEIKDYFNNLTDDDYLKFDDHPQSSIGKLLDKEEPAPWD